MTSLGMAWLSASRQVNSPEVAENESSSSAPRPFPSASPKPMLAKVFMLVTLLERNSASVALGLVAILNADDVLKLAMQQWLK